MLISWLLMSDQSDETEDNSNPHPVLCRWASLFTPSFIFFSYLQTREDKNTVFFVLCRDFTDSLIANILVSLTLKDTRAGLRFLLGAKGAAG